MRTLQLPPKAHSLIASVVVADLLDNSMAAQAKNMAFSQHSSESNVPMTNHFIQEALASGPIDDHTSKTKLRHVTGISGEYEKWVL